MLIKEPFSPFKMCASESKDINKPVINDIVAYLTVFF